MHNEVMKFYNQYCYPHPGNYFFDPKRERKHASSTIGYNHIDKRILVVGCGSCEAVMAANTNPRSHVVGIDISETQIAVSKSIKRKFRIKNLSHHVSDICDLKVNMEFDIIDATGVLHHIEELNIALNNIKNLLSNDGKFVGMIYSKNRPKIIRERCNFFRESNFKPEDVFEWMKNKETSIVAKAWFFKYIQNNIEVADTWLNPYFKEYEENEWRDILYSSGFDEVNIKYNDLKTNLVFETIKKL